MNSIIVVTGNKGKYNEIRKILNSFNIDSECVDLSFPETEETIEKISVEKARNAFSVVKKPLIVDDTGVFFDAYNNFPGRFAKRIFNSIGFHGIMNLLNGESQRARFKSVVCYTDGEITKTFIGELTGSITDKIYPTERPELPYEQIFIPDGKNKPISLMTIEEKNEISHRAKAVKKFAKWYVEYVRKNKERSEGQQAL